MRVTMIAAALLMSVAARQAGAAESKDWKTAESRSFRAYSNASEGELRSTLKELEAFRTTLKALFPALSLTSDSRVTIVLFKDHSAFVPFGPRDNGKLEENIAGYFTRSSRGDLFVIGAIPDGMTLDTAYHDYVHSIVQRNLRNVPAWVNEGIADFYSRPVRAEHLDLREQHAIK